jgi:hypothetical protein
MVSKAYGNEAAAVKAQACLPATERLIKTAAHVCQILDCFSPSATSLSLSEIATSIGLRKSSVPVVANARRKWIPCSQSGGSALSARSAARQLRTRICDVGECSITGPAVPRKAPLAHAGDGDRSNAVRRRTRSAMGHLLSGARLQ